MQSIEEILAERSEYILDLSLIMYLAQFEISEEGNGVRFLVPQVLQELLESNDVETLQLIERVFGVPLFVSRSRLLDLSLLRVNLNRLQSRGELEYFDEDVDQDVQDISFQIVPEPRRFEMRRAATFVRKYVSGILTRSRRGGQAILMKTRQLPTLLRERIAVLELPSRADRLVEQKSGIMRRLFGFRGGRSTKAFIGITIAVGGIYWLPVGVAGVAFAFADP